MGKSNYNIDNDNEWITTSRRMEEEGCSLGWTRTSSLLDNNVRNHINTKREKEWVNWETRWSFFDGTNHEGDRDKTPTTTTTSRQDLPLKTCQRMRDNKRISPKRRRRRNDMTGKNEKNDEWARTWQHQQFLHSLTPWLKSQKQEW
jgi:hypothetical protein